MPAANSNLDNRNDAGAPALGLVAITPSDSTDLSTAVRSIYVGVGGDVCVIDTAGNTVTHVGAPQGGYLGPFAVARVKATGTTASSLIGYI
jgi:hypothetical protein